MSTSNNDSELGYERADILAKEYSRGSSFMDGCMERPAYRSGYHRAILDCLEWIKNNVPDKEELFRQDF